MSSITIQGDTLSLAKPAAEMLARVEQGMSEQRRIAPFFGRQNTQSSQKLMSLTMLAAGPYRHLRQCAAEIERKRSALSEASVTLRRARLEALRATEEAETLTGYARDLKLLDAEEKSNQVSGAEVYVLGAIKDLASLQDAYEQIRKAAGIPEDWTEADAEAGEAEHHLRSLFRLAYRDVLGSGRIGAAASEYGEQLGVHPQVLARRVADYLAACEQSINQGSAPTINHFHDWLDACYEAHKDGPAEAARRIGISRVVTDWALLGVGENQP